MNHVATRLSAGARGRAAAILPLVVTLAGACSDDSRVTLTPEEVEGVCVHLVACQQAAGAPQSLSECVDSLGMMGLAELGNLDVSDVMSCLESAGADCDRLLACGNEGRPLESCDPQTFASRCDGAMMVTCSGGVVVYFDCSRFDAIYGSAACALEAGSSPECVGTKTCTSTTTECHGNVLEACIEGQFMRLDCGFVGAECGKASLGIDYCVGTGAPCADEDAASCAGTALVRCLGGRQATLDCPAVSGPGATCVPSATGGDAECGAGGTECIMDETPDTCDGTQLVFCRQGYSDRVDCVAFGYAACVPTETGAACQ